MEYLNPPNNQLWFLSQISNPDLICGCHLLFLYSLILFRGFMKSHIYFNSTTSKWILESLLFPNAWLETEEQKEIPVGTNLWIVGSEKGMCQIPKGKAVKLTFCTCYPDKFTCKSGHCIPLR